MVLCCGSGWCWGGKGAGFWPLWFYFRACFPVPGPCHRPRPLVPPRCGLQRLSFPRASQEVGNSLSPFNLGINFGFNLGIFCTAGRRSPSRSPLPPAEQRRALQPLPRGALFFFSFLSKFPSRFCCHFSPCFHHGFLPWRPGERGSVSAPGRARPRRSTERAALERKISCWFFFFWKGYDYLPLPSYSEGFGFRRFDLAFTAAWPALGLLELTLC